MGAEKLLKRHDIQHIFLHSSEIYCEDRTSACIYDCCKCFNVIQQCFIAANSTQNKHIIIFIQTWGVEPSNRAFVIIIWFDSGVCSSTMSLHYTRKYLVFTLPFIFDHSITKIWLKKIGVCLDQIVKMVNNRNLYILYFVEKLTSEMKSACPNPETPFKRSFMKIE